MFYRQEKKKKKKSKPSAAAAADPKPHTADGLTPSAPLSVAKAAPAKEHKVSRRRDLAARIEEVVEE